MIIFYFFIYIFLLFFNFIYIYKYIITKKKINILFIYLLKNFKALNNLFKKKINII